MDNRTYLLDRPCELFVSNNEYNTLVIVCESFYADTKFTVLSKDSLIDDIRKGNELLSITNETLVCKSLRSLLDYMTILHEDGIVDKLITIDSFFDESSDEDDVIFMKDSDSVKTERFEELYYVNIHNSITENDYIAHVEGEVHLNRKYFGTFVMPSEILRDYIKLHGVNGWFLNQDSRSTCNLLVNISFFDFINQYFVSRLSYSPSDHSNNERVQWTYENQDLVLDKKYLDRITYDPETNEYSYGL